MKGTKAKRPKPGRVTGQKAVTPFPKRTKKLTKGSECPSEKTGCHYLGRSVGEDSWHMYLPEPFNRREGQRSGDAEMAFAGRKKKHPAGLVNVGKAEVTGSW